MASLFHDYLLLLQYTPYLTSKFNEHEWNIYQISWVTVDSEQIVKDLFNSQALGCDEKAILVEEVQEHGVGERQHDGKQLTS